MRPRPVTRRSPKHGKGCGAGVSRRGAHVPALGEGSLLFGLERHLVRVPRRGCLGAGVGAGQPAGLGAGAAAGGTWGRLAVGDAGEAGQGRRRQAWDSLLLWLVARDGLRKGETGRGLGLRRGGECGPRERLRLWLRLGEGARGGGAATVWSDSLPATLRREGGGRRLPGQSAGCQAPPARATSASKSTNRPRVWSGTASSCTPPTVKHTRSMRRRTQAS